MSRAVVIAVFAVAAACCPPIPQDCIGFVEGACVVLDSKDPATITSADLARIDAALVEGGRFWDVNPARVLSGYTIVLHGSTRAVCDGNDTKGCCHWECHRIDLGTPDGSEACIEWSAIHELGHAVIRDPDHSDPRWHAVCHACFGVLYCPGGP